MVKARKNNAGNLFVTWNKENSVNRLNDFYYELESALRLMDNDTDPSELHGTVGGLLCADNRANVNHWLASLFPEIAAKDAKLGELKRSLGRLFEETRQQLADPMCGFDLLLPGEDYSFEQQLLALGEWCQGFLIGLNLGGIEDFNSLQGEAKEFARDMVEIARAGVSYDFSDDDEEDQRAYVQLVEYVRVGVMMVNDELNAIPGSKESKPTLH